VLPVGGGVAYADESPAGSPAAAPATTAAADAVTRTSVVVQAAQLAQHRIPATAATGLLKDKVAHYLLAQAQSGRLVGIADIDIVSVPVAGGGTVGAILSRSDSLNGLAVDLVNEVPVALGASFADVREPDLVSAAAPGYDGGVNRSGMSRTNSACRDLWFDASYPTANNGDHHVYDCWEKWHDTRAGAQWAYNRYTLFDPADGASGYKGQIIDATIRSRPWRGYESRVNGGPYNYAPTPADNCTTYTATIGVPSGSSLQIPSVQCSAALQVFPKGTDHSMGTDWGGRTTGQVYLDEAFRMTTPSATAAAPMYADYLWMQVEYCYGPGNCYQGNPSDYEKYADSGW
jgi:hypothetical protein